MLLCCFFIVAYGQTCGYCNGTGKMITNKGGSTYGHSNDDLVWCNDCQKYFYRSTGHAHIHCKYCKGTGRRQSSNSSSSSGYTSTDEIAAIDPQAYGMAMNALYGLPTTEEEMNYIRKMLAENETNGRRYIEFRNNLNNAKIHFTRNMRMGNTSGTTVQQLDKYYESIIRRANEIMENLYFPYDRALRILQEHAGTVEAAYKSYRSAVGFQQNLNNLNDQLFMQELIRNSIY